MYSSRLFGLTLFCLAIAVQARADVTIKSKGGGSGMVGAMSGDMTQYIKGVKVRIDQTTGKGRDTTTIIDMAARQMITLNHESKEADVIDMAGLGASMEKAGVTDISVSLTPTSQTRQIAGQTCTVHDLKISVPMQMGNMKMAMLMSGPQCLVKNAPGQADYLAFHKAASENGGFFDPQQAKTRPAAAKAMTDMYRKMAELGVPYATELTMGFEGQGPMADMMKKMANTITTEVTSVSTSPIAASMFDVPAGYKVNKR
jgi:FtsP/CotA-like multicopper oxidase with cupredoxin domain